MKRFFLLALAVPLTAACTQPTDMYQTAVIKSIDSNLCFSVADTQETRKEAPTITAIAVDRFEGGQWTRVWQWLTPLTPATRLGPGNCIAYGHQTAVDSVRASPPPLRVGERYGVEINSQIPNPSAKGDRMLGRMYGQEFCLRSLADGKVEVVLVPRTQGKLQWQQCELSP